MNAFSALIIVFILALDQITKFFILKFLSLNSELVIIPQILSFRTILNTGAGFSILQNHTNIVIAVSVFSILFLIYVLAKNQLKNKFFTISLLFIISGAAGNLIDRLRFGAVIDFIDFKIWPVFNIADIFITIGAFLIFSVLFFKKRN